jgi:hypothetical protein
LKTYLILLIMGMSACHSMQQAPMPADASAKPGPPALIYKTRADYDNRVPVILNESKTTIVSYPHPSDLKNDKGYLTPLRLKKGYLLDRKGINGNVAFLSMTYETYAALKEPPSMQDLEGMIIDRDPLTELCNCGNLSSYTHPEAQFNSLIRKKTLHKTCKIIR